MVISMRDYRNRPSAAAASETAGGMAAVAASAMPSASSLLSPPSTLDVFLQPAQYFVGDGKYRVHALLSAGISLTLWHRQRRIGAMSSCVVASRLQKSESQPDAYYLEDAVPLLMNDLRNAHIDPSECEARIFFGADRHRSTILPRGRSVFGGNHGEAVHAILRSHGVRTTTHGVLGDGHERIVFDLHSGRTSSHRRHRSPVDNALTPRIPS